VSKDRSGIEPVESRKDEYRDQSVSDRKREKMRECLYVEYVDSESSLGNRRVPRNSLIWHNRAMTT
jgi:hypothetical protein